MPVSSPPKISAALLGRGAPEALALIEGDRTLCYEELRAEVQARVVDLALAPRSTVVLTGAAGAEWVVTYLALLEGGQIPLLAADHVDRLVDAWDPAAVVDARPNGLEVAHRHSPPTGTEPHPDLALLMSTSGSTGSPKLVRLSHRNLVSNADAIGAALGLTDQDCGITSLPLHYCFGLSVLHSHLAAGARLVATTASVVDPCFAAAVRNHEVTSVVGVPHTFDLLETAGPERVLAPSVRFLAQAGGRMDPAARERWRGRTAAAGIDLVVMYGQTEATARMAYLPPALAAACPDAVGVAVPGGELRVDPVPGRTNGVGELVYRGDNVMMGYAIGPTDLALGAVVDELRTGDLGRLDVEHGVFEVVGRTSRFIKPFGLRIDLDAVETHLRAVLGPVAATGDDDRLVLVAPGLDPATVRVLVRDLCGLPDRRVDVLTGPIPRTSSGKVDHGAIREEAAQAAPGTDDDLSAFPPQVRSISSVLAEILGRRPLDPTDTFASAGGDSLSYIEASMRIEQVVGSLPDDWQHLPMADLDALGATLGAPGGAFARLDTSVLLRAIAICTVVATHMGLAFLPGGAHLLLAVVGYNLSRFQLTLQDTGQRIRAGLCTVGRVAVPTVLWAGAMFALGRGYGWTTIGLVNNYLGPRGHQRGLWHFWFIEAFVQLVLLTMLVMAVPAVRRLDRKAPYAFPLALLAATMAARWITVAGIDDPFNLRFRTHGVAAFFVLGWLVQRSTTQAQKLLTSVLCLVTVVGFFGQPYREAYIVVGILVLIWARAIVFPRRLVPLAGILAAASMWILISHFQVWPVLLERLPMAVAYPATIAVGIAIWKATEVVPRWVRRRLAARGVEAGREPDAARYASPALGQ